MWICYLVFAIALTRVAVEGGPAVFAARFGATGPLARAPAAGRRNGLADVPKRSDAGLADSGRLHHSYARFYHALVFARVQTGARPKTRVAAIGRSARQRDFGRGGGFVDNERAIGL